jgi:ubiquinone/menaquinone biosynthesis C-methylase UbiE
MYTDAEKVLSEFKRVLIPGGKLYIMTDLWRWLLIPPNKNVLSLFIYWFKLGYMFCRGIKYKFFTINSFEALCKKSGFTIISNGQDGETSFNQSLKNSNHISFYEKKPINSAYLWEVCAVKVN